MQLSLQWSAGRATASAFRGSCHTPTPCLPKLPAAAFSQFLDPLRSPTSPRARLFLLLSLDWLVTLTSFQKYRALLQTVQTLRKLRQAIAQWRMNPEAAIESLQKPVCFEAESCPLILIARLLWRLAGLVAAAAFRGIPTHPPTPCFLSNTRHSPFTYSATYSSLSPAITRLIVRHHKFPEMSNRLDKRHAARKFHAIRRGIKGAEGAIQA